MPGVATAAPSTHPLAVWLASNKRSQRWLADEVGCHQSMISMLIRGERAARGDLALKIHEKTKVALKVLIARPRPDSD